MAMLRITRRAGAGAPHASADLILTWDQRQRSRLRVRADDGREVALLLPRGTAVRDGDLLQADDGAVLRVRAAAEELSTVSSAEPLPLLRACFHLANRHVPLEISPGRLSYRRDHVLDAMLGRLGLIVEHRCAPFEAEAGAYSHGAGH